MTEKPKTSPPKWNYGQVKSVAEQFLKKHHPQFAIPIPIEEIIELNLGVKISTIPNLKRDFSIDGFINSSFDAITVDDEVFNNCEQRARFTIAHELGHGILHQKIYKQFTFNGLEDYIKFQNKIPQKDLYWLDIQANIFAGCVLVPTKKLKEEIKNALEEVGIKGKIQKDYGLPFLEKLPLKFNVSAGVIIRRIEKEKLLLERI